MLAAANVANIKIRYDAKTPQFAIFGTRVICVFYSIYILYKCVSVCVCVCLCALVKPKWLHLDSF